MAVGSITITTVQNQYPALPVTADHFKVAMAAATVTDGDDWAAVRGDILLIHNTDGAIEYDYTLVSEIDPTTQRTGDLVIAVGAGEIHAVDFSVLRGFADATTGKVLGVPENAAIFVGVLRA